MLYHVESFCGISGLSKGLEIHRLVRHRLLHFLILIHQNMGLTGWKFIGFSFSLHTRREFGCFNFSNPNSFLRIWVRIQANSASADVYGV